METIRFPSRLANTTSSVLCLVEYGVGLNFYAWLIDAFWNVCYHRPCAVRDLNFPCAVPNMAKPTYDFPVNARFEDAARSVLRSGFKKMIDNLDGTRAGLDKSVATPDEVEALHDMRVGSRRLRAALAVFGRLFSEGQFKALDKEVGRITDALGAVRDLDVQLESLSALPATLPANEAYGVGRLFARQTKRRDRERKALIIVLDEMQKDRFDRRFKRLLAEATSHSKGEAK